MSRSPPQTGQSLDMSTPGSKTFWAFPSRYGWRLCKAIGADWRTLTSTLVRRRTSKGFGLTVSGERFTKRRAKIAMFSNNYGVFTNP
jgi:hypothetical protein